MPIAGKFMISKIAINCLCKFIVGSVYIQIGSNICD